MWPVIQKSETTTARFVELLGMGELCDCHHRLRQQKEQQHQRQQQQQQARQYRHDYHPNNHDSFL